MTHFSGCYTALVTPILANRELDYEGLRRLVEFQINEGVSGILACGTTGESATLDWNEHNKVTEKINEYVGDDGLTMAGTGSNSTQEAIEGTLHAQHLGIKCVLLVDPYYNGPSSLEIRKEYLEPVAEQFPDIQVIPYVIPGRTGTQLLPQDLAMLHKQCPNNVRAVKEATGNFENMQLTRKFCGADFDILSGDDEKTFRMITSPDIKAAGAISVTSNIAPRAVSDMIRFAREGQTEQAQQLFDALQPLFGLVTVKTQEPTPYGEVLVKARNPLPCKTLMNILGMPSGSCRQPLGKMTKAGIEVVLQVARTVYEANPEILEPIAEYFDVNLQTRLSDPKYLEGLYYD
ncbi:MAG: 4-hydroxy-tetrahydrodipicolinate synthase [Candidatus Bathyarchaeota archaeon]|nr:4-hydroxy-tetrahydrodipicolinate synthase [Candidatus Bathyarchaeota archaeon]